MTSKLFCFLCFENLENLFHHTNKTVVYDYVSKQPFQSFGLNSESDGHFPMFVTWKNKGQLRGCKGSFKALPLFDGLKDMTKDAAFNDGRFHHVEESELPHLTCSVSLLHTFEKAENPLDWDIGKHGIRLFLDGRSSTYLPHVASDHGWDKMEALQHLARKGGYTKRYDEDALSKSKVERYQAFRESASWDEYQNFLKSL